MRQFRVLVAFFLLVIGLAAPFAASHASADIGPCRACADRHASYAGPPFIELSF